MKASDASLIELARLTKVRPYHVFHLYHYRREMKERFSPEGYAAFAQLDLKHVQAILAVLPDCPTRKPRQPAVKTMLPEGWEMPEDWLLMARERRFWTMDVCRTEAERFYNWHRAKGTLGVDWKAGWRNWIDGSRRENGNVNQKASAFESEESRRAYLDGLR